MSRRLAVPAALLALGAPSLLAIGGSPGAGAAVACTPDATPTYAGQIPTGREVLGFDIGSQEATAPELNAYVAAVDAASDEVSTGTFGKSVQGRPLTYAVVGDPVDVSAAQRAARVLRNPDTSPARAAAVAAAAPAIAWMAGNVHGNEPSGGDGALQMLYDLADRTDCAARRIRDNTVTVIIPSQNPDGRELYQRRNTFGFDLNRDWFARTQAETDGKLSLLLRYPPVLLSDNHEMGGESFFFPPNADPIHHEVADRSISWINDFYGGAMAAEFDRRGWSHFSYDVYDLLYMGYGDSVPTTALNGAAMTYEKGGDAPVTERTEQQFVATWASMYALADSKNAVLRGWASSYREARAQGRAGKLEPNHVFEEGNTVEREVPDERVRSYFIRSTAGKQREARALVRRLQRMEVVVRRLTRRLVVPDYRPYGDSPRRIVLPAGTWYVPMAQAQKHWVQAMLGEDSYVPFPYFYDVTSWSGPLLFNVPAGRSGAMLRPASRPAARVSAPAAPSLPRSTPAVGLWLTDDSTSAYESEGWLRWLFESKWRLPYRSVSTPGISEGALAPLDVLVVPNGDAEATYDALGPDGRRTLREWVAAGGRVVSMRGGTQLAALLQLTTARLSDPTSDVPGSLLRVRTRPSALTRGVGGQAWNYYEYDQVMRLARPSAAAVSYPPGSRFFVSGYERDADELRGTAAVAAERYADGRVVVFAGDPNFRAFTDGTQRILWNAILGRDPAPKGLDAATAPAATARAAAAARGVRQLGDDATVTVTVARQASVLAAVRASGRTPRVDRLGGDLVRISWRVPDSDGRPELGRLLDRIGAGPGVLSARVP